MTSHNKFTNIDTIRVMMSGVIPATREVCRDATTRATMDSVWDTNVVSDRVWVYVDDAVDTTVKQVVTNGLERALRKYE